MAAPEKIVRPGVRCDKGARRLLRLTEVVDRVTEPSGRNRVCDVREAFVIVSVRESEPGKLEVVGPCASCRIPMRTRTTILGRECCRRDEGQSLSPLRMCLALCRRISVIQGTTRNASLSAAIMPVFSRRGTERRRRRTKAGSTTAPPCWH